MFVLTLFDITLPFDIVVIPFFFKFSQPLTLLSPGFPSICQLLLNLFYFFVFNSWLVAPECAKNNLKANLVFLLPIGLCIQLVFDSRANKSLSSFFDSCPLIQLTLCITYSLATVRASFFTHLLYFCVPPFHPS